MFGKLLFEYYLRKFLIFYKTFFNIIQKVFVYFQKHFLKNQKILLEDAKPLFFIRYLKLQLMFKCTDAVKSCKIKCDIDIVSQD